MVKKGSDPRVFRGQLECGPNRKSYREPLKYYISKIMVPLIPVSGQCNHVSTVAKEVF